MDQRVHWLEYFSGPFRAYREPVAAPHGSFTRLTQVFHGKQTISTIHEMERLLWICVGGATGTAARYLIALWAAQRFGSAFPYGTLLVNLIGCFSIAVVMQVALTLAWPPTLRSAVTIGFIGGLTTYSSFNYETTRLLQDGSMGAAALNAALTIAGGFAAGWLGLVCARQLLGR